MEIYRWLVTSLLMVISMLHYYIYIHERKKAHRDSLLPSHRSGVYKKNELHFEIFI